MTYERPQGSPRGFLFTGDRVWDSALNVEGTVREHGALSAWVRWDDGRLESVEHWTPTVAVTDFARAA